MGNIAVICTDTEINNAIETHCGLFKDAFSPVYLSDHSSVFEYLNYELPEINVINASDETLIFQNIMSEIEEDPWLHYGGFIIIYDKGNERKLTNVIRHVNVIALIRKATLDDFFPRVLRILNTNRTFIFQRDIHLPVSSLHTGEFKVDNDPFELNTYSNLITNYLYNTNVITFEQKDYFHVGLMELLLNAIEHGNCKIDYQEKTDWLEQGKDILELIREKNKDPEIQMKKIHLSYRMSPESLKFTICDEGDGFDWRSHKTLTGSDGLQETHGRGIAMAKFYLSDLAYNDKGNEVSFNMKQVHAKSNVIPTVFTDMEEVTFQNQDVVFEEGEESTFLYFIVSGTYAIYSKNEKIATLTSDDIFVGEMSFLLNNKRSARVVTEGTGVLIRISKRAFIKAIKGSPHYGIFLARLLAQRLAQRHREKAE